MFEETSLHSCGGGRGGGGGGGEGIKFDINFVESIDWVTKCVIQMRALTDNIVLCRM